MSGVELVISLGSRTTAEKLRSALVEMGVNQPDIDIRGNTDGE